MRSRRARLQCHLRPCWVGEFPILARPDPIREGAPPYKSRFAEETRAPVASALLHASRMVLLILRAALW